jgi:hypothetical protein
MQHISSKVNDEIRKKEVEGKGGGGKNERCSYHVSNRDD